MKAENARLSMTLVNPAGTSQDHSNCCHRVNKELSHRWHL
ncbi:MAG: transposase [Cyanobacteria bacterium REEB444]|nr:transposase [Cyanobacteria bacterium REEB444]